MRLALAVASVLAALSSPAAAQSVAPRFLQSAGRLGGTPRPAVAIKEPPASYVRPFAGPVIERVLPLKEARAACAKRGVRADACAWASKGSCYVVIPSAGAPVTDLAAYRRHEIAHCNGWNH